MGQGRMQNRGRRDRSQRNEPESEFTEEVIYINRVAKVVKGGRKFHFTALVALGDKKTRVGLGYGKALEVVDAIKKAVDDAKRNMITVYKNGTTIPYELKNHYCASTAILLPVVAILVGTILGAAVPSWVGRPGWSQTGCALVGAVVLLALALAQV